MIPELNKDELCMLDTQLKKEQILVEKYKNYALICKDPQLRTKCEQMAAQHQTHYKLLQELLK